MTVSPLRGFLFSLLAFPIAAASAPRDAEVTGRFAALLERDDVTAIRELAPDAVDPATAWRSAVSIIDRLNCIEIESVTSDAVTDVPGERLLRVAIRGTGLTAGATRRVEMLPNVWFLRIVTTGKEWRVAEVQTAEQRLATAMIAAASDEERRALLDPHVDLARLSALMAFDSAEPEMGDRGFASIRFARDLAAAAGDSYAFQRTKQMEATLHSMLGHYDEGIRIATESVEESLATGDPDTISSAWFTAAVAHWAKNDIPSATDYFRRSASLADSMTNPLVAAKALVNLSFLEESRGNLSRALDAANATAKLSRDLGWIQGQTDALMRQQSYEFRLGNYAAARRTGHEAYALALELGHHDKIQLALMNLGMEALVRDPDEAIGFFAPLVDVPSLGAFAEIQIAEALARKHRPAEAMRRYEHGAAVAEATNLFAWAAVANAQLSRLVQREDPQRALELARKARELGRDATALRGIAPASYLKAAEASALLALGRTTEAEPLYEEVVAAYQVERDSVELTASTHTDFYRGLIGPVHDLIGLKLKRGMTADAIRLSERVKASVLDEAQRGERADAGASVSAEERAEQQKNEEEITRLNREIFRARDEKRVAALKASLAEARARWESVETSLHSRDPLSRPHSEPDPLQSPDTLLPNADNVIVDYVVMESKTILFVLSRDERQGLHIDTHTIDITSGDLQRAIDRFASRLADASLDYEDDARRLYRLILGPASKILRQRKVLVVIPDGPLWRLPFQALQPKDGQPLIAQFTVFYAPSLQSLLRAPKDSTPRRTVLAIGNPQFEKGATEMLRARTRATLADLPDAADEARRIAQLYGGTRSRTLIGREATEGAVKEQAAAYDVLHIAAHAVVDDAQPLYSSIVLAGDSVNDGLLEGREITRLRLHARLAVLSACSTAQGQVRAGEGLIALSWAFLAAGCPTVVATQWTVPSESTATLMVDFHRRLAGGATVADALRLAQLQLRKDRRYRHPFYWSPFVVVGAGRS